MIFLWSFGIVVEGKLGAAGFLPVYLGIGVVESAILQLVSHPEQPIHMLGASGAIYGLLAMCLVWAPRNELNCWAFFRFVPFEWDVPILWFAVFYIGLEVFEVGTTGFSISSALAHAGGAAIGFAVAVGLLKAGLVDCENWDLFAVLEGRQGRPKGAAARKPRRVSLESHEHDRSRPRGRGRPRRRGSPSRTPPRRRFGSSAGTSSSARSRPRWDSTRRPARNAPRGGRPMPTGST